MVDNEGNVRGYRNTGVATIRATSTFDPTIYKEIDIEVKKVDVTEITLASSNNELEHGSFLSIGVNVEKKLHECKVQGVYSLFNALSEEEKEEFLRLINRL